MKPRSFTPTFAQPIGVYGSGIDAAAYAGRLLGWANVNGRGHYNAPHRHSGFDLSGCFYLVQPSVTSDATGTIEFLDQRNLSAKAERFCGPMFSSSFALRSEPGQIVVFPSSLTHWVPPNQSDDDRTVIAWNFDLIDR